MYFDICLIGYILPFLKKIVMKLLSVYIGKPRTIEYEGKEVRTGIFKELHEGPANVKTLNIEGDGQADLRVHGGINKAVYAYPSEHYAYWKEKYPNLNYEGSAFGENLSVSGMSEQSVCIGDIYQIGTTKFMVTNPRMPCFKLGIKMQMPAFVGFFLEARLNGFYFKVVEEGTIEAGQNIQLISSDGYNLTVDEVILAYHKEKKNKMLLTKAAQAPNLPEDWTSFFQQKLDKL